MTDPNTPQGVVAGSIPLFAGHPAPDLLPIADIQHALDAAWGQPGVAQMFNYGDEQGNRRLIDFLVERLNRDESLDISRGHLMIVGGSTWGVSMITRHLTQAGDLILVDAPSYRDALHIFRDGHLEMAAVPVDDDGAVVEAMERRLQTGKAMNRLPKFYYAVPNFQNPSGITVSQARREAIVALSQSYGFVILEDDVYRDIRFTDRLPPSFYALAQGKNVLRLGSFSKTLAPGMRVGWLIAEPDRIQGFTGSGLLRMGGGANPFTAKVIADYCRGGAWEAHVQWLRTQYQARRDTALAALQAAMPPSVQWTQPEGGYFIWLTLPESVSVDDLEPLANSRGVYFAAGKDFFVHPDDGRHHIRLSFSFAPPKDMARGIDILGRLIGQLASR